MNEKERHELYVRLAQMVETLVNARHIETLEAFSIIDSIIDSISSSA